MNEQIAGTIRHILTAAGGALVSSGVVSAEVWAQIVGGLVAAIGLGWSLYVKRKAK